ELPQMEHVAQGDGVLNPVLDIGPPPPLMPVAGPQGRISSLPGNTPTLFKARRRSVIP
ncbi:hypothetical protein ALQ58_01959, partial [Pseudomonas syringae pv. apii]